MWYVYVEECSSAFLPPVMLHLSVLALMGVLASVACQMQLLNQLDCDRIEDKGRKETNGDDHAYVGHGFEVQQCVCGTPVTGIAWHGLGWGGSAGCRLFVMAGLQIGCYDLITSCMHCHAIPG